MRHTKNKSHNYVAGICLNCGDVCEHVTYHWEEVESYPAYPDTIVYSFPAAICDGCGEHLDTVDPVTDDDMDASDFQERE